MTTQMWTVAAVLVLVLGSSAEQPCSDACFCPSGSYIDCAARELTQPPAGNWPDVRNLNLDSNRIQQLYQHSLSGFGNVAVLYLMRNALTELDLGALSDVKSLHQLYVQSNEITKIVAPPAGETLSHLTNLYLTGNKIASLDPDVLLAAPNLARLDLDQNPLVVPSGKSVLNHPTVSVLNVIQAASLDLGSVSFAGLPNLRQIDLHSTVINTIAGAFASNQKLASVTLRNTSLSEVPSGTFAPANALQLLYLDANPGLQRFPASAVQEVVPPGGRVVIDNSALACTCGYSDLYLWAQVTGANLFASCNGEYPCHFTAEP